MKQMKEKMIDETGCDAIMIGRGVLGNPWLIKECKDYLENGIDLNKELIRHPSTTFFGRVKGDSMCGAGIYEDDILVIDKSLDARNDDIAVCFIDGEFTLKRIRKEKDAVLLIPANEKYKPITVTADNDFIIWGIVTSIVRKIRR